MNFAVAKFFACILKKPAKTLLRTTQVTKISINLLFGGAKKCQGDRSSEAGKSIVEIVIVVVIIGVISAMAIPQMISSRRLTRSSAIPKEIMTRLRETRQYAMAQRQAFTFIYNDSNKTVSIVDQNTSLSTNSGMLTLTGFPNPTTSTTLMTVPLNVGGVPSGEISYGIPSGINPVSVTEPGGLTALASVNSNNIVTVTFQPDGRVLDANSLPVSSTALYFYNPQAPSATASAISILGSGGRVKIWKYSPSANKYVE